MSQKSNFKIDRRFMVIAIILLLAMYIVLPQVGQFKSSLNQLSHPNIGWTSLAILFTFATYLAGAATYCLLAFRRLNYLLTVLVQFAAMFVNRLLPGGIGALGANFVYLKRQKHTSAQSASVVAVNNFLGAVGHYLLLGIIILVTGYSTIAQNGPPSTLGHNIRYVWIGIVALAVVVLIFGWNKFKRSLVEFKNQLLDYRHRPTKLALALLTSICLTSFNILALYACANALGVQLNLAIIMLVFTLGIGAGTATPTPGGLGGFEAGLVAGLVSFDVDSSTALAIALLYRLISYWLTLGAGAVAFVFAERKQLL